MCFEFPVLLSRMLCWYFAHQRSAVFRGQCGSTSADILSTVAREQVWCGVVAAGHARRHESCLWSMARGRKCTVMTKRLDVQSKKER